MYALILVPDGATSGPIVGSQREMTGDPVPNVAYVDLGARVESVEDIRVATEGKIGALVDGAWALVDAPDQTDPTSEEMLKVERLDMRCYRLAFEDAAAQTAWGPGTLLDAIDAMLGQVPANLARRYNNITQFERLRSEVQEFLIDGLGMTPEQVDELFRDAMQIEADFP